MFNPRVCTLVQPIHEYYNPLIFGAQPRCMAPLGFQTGATHPEESLQWPVSLDTQASLPPRNNSLFRGDGWDLDTQLLTKA